MICVTAFLTTALAGLPAGTCALQCDMSGGFAITVTGNGCRGQVQVVPNGEWITVHKDNGRWFAVLEQVNEQCVGVIHWANLRKEQEPADSQEAKP